MDVLTPELSAILVQAMVLVGQLLRQARRQKQTQSEVEAIHARVRSLPCISIRTPVPTVEKPTLDDASGLPTIGHPGYGCPVDS